MTHNTFRTKGLMQGMKINYQSLTKGNSRYTYLANRTPSNWKRELCFL